MSVSAIELAQMQGLPLHLKIIKTVARLSEFYDTYNGMVYCAFSGGMDSTILADIIKRSGLNIPLVFCNTGNEYPDLVKFALSKNPVVIRPEHSFKWVCEHYGFPVVSKEVSKNISRYRNTKSDLQKQLRLNGGICPASGKRQARGIPLKYHYLVDAPFKISDMCCEIIKKRPFKKYDKESRRFPITAEIADESIKRRFTYMKTGCNNYNSKIPKSMPMGFWKQQDVLAYALAFDVKYAPTYGKIEYDPEKKILYTTKEKRTGCYNCMYGVQMEGHPNRFERMKIEYPELYNVCMNQGCGMCMDFIRVAH
ncbi:MAG: phosphoadenosine phosphosulfate reductase family protein [Methanoregula sp.]|jgi:3'-phosphoadenosine 5'-phosphosulfate sulfotransferase (PAPS reductase)/FAD synthetase|nr:phosphoadenosine phosphosulfate reductase family protein [Methanoregula sp.]